MDLRYEPGHKYRRIEVHIEELVLQDFSYPDPERLKEAVIGALGKILADQPLPGPASILRKAASIDAGSFKMEMNSKPEVLGNQIAQGIYTGICRNI